MIIICSTKSLYTCRYAPFMTMQFLSTPHYKHNTRVFYPVPYIDRKNSKIPSRSYAYPCYAEYQCLMPLNSRHYSIHLCICSNYLAVVIRPALSSSFLRLVGSGRCNSTSSDTAPRSVGEESAVRTSSIGLAISSETGVIISPV
jgi:hypothetical protein